MKSNLKKFILSIFVTIPLLSVIVPVTSNQRVFAETNSITKISGEMMDRSFSIIPVQDNPHDGGRKGRWVYQYTVNPYSFYKRSVTGEIRTLQTTSTIDHTINTIVGGWTDSQRPYLANAPYYNPSFAHLMDGQP